MPTAKQAMAIAYLVENGGKMKDAMLKAGYSPETAHTPQKLTNSVPFKELMNARGLTDELLTDSLKEDILAKPQNRLGELALMAKLKGHLREQENPMDRMVVVLPNSLVDKTVEQNTLRDVSSDTQGNKLLDTSSDTVPNV